MNALDQIASLNGKIAYCNAALAQGGLMVWEAKEYSGLVDQYTQELFRLQDVVAQHPNLF